MRPGNGLRKNRRGWHDSEAVFLSVSILRHDTYFWKASTRTLHDMQHRNRLDLCTSWAQNHAMEPNHLNPLELEKYAEAVFNKGAPLSNCFGFVDGTVRPITRPGENQRLLYNGISWLFHRLPSPPPQRSIFLLSVSNRQVNCMYTNIAVSLYNQVLILSKQKEGSMMQQCW